MKSGRKQELRVMVLEISFQMTSAAIQWRSIDTCQGNFCQTLESWLSQFYRPPSTHTARWLRTVAYKAEFTHGKNDILAL